MRTYDTDVLDLLDEGRADIAGMILFSLGEGSYGFIQRVEPYTWSGVDFVPIPAGIFSVSDLPGSTGTAAFGFQITLSESPDDGLTPEAILNLETLDYRERPVTVYDLPMHPDTGVVLSDPIPMVSGYINSVSHMEDPSTGYMMTIECETRAIDYTRTNGRIRTTEDQARRSAGDLFFEHTGVTGRVKIDWGK